jgi:large subunit ribosomal protein L22
MKATLRFLRISARKTRLVADIVRGQKVEDAIFMLAVTRRAASEPISKLIASSRENAKNADEDLELSDLYVKEIYVNEGPTLKRFRPRAMGRATRINKRTSHVTCVLGVKG